MAETEIRSSQTLQASSPPAEDESGVDLSTYPAIFVSSTHFETDDLLELEEALVDAGASLTYDIKEARIILSKVLKKPRILFDLRANGLWTEEASAPNASTRPADELPPLAKKRKVDHTQKGSDASKAIVIIDDESTASEDEGDPMRSQGETLHGRHQEYKATNLHPSQSSATQAEDDLVKVVNVTWFEQSRQAGQGLPLTNFLTYQGRRIERPAPESDPTTSIDFAKPSSTKLTTAKRSHSNADILERAREDSKQFPRPKSTFGKRTYGRYADMSKAEASWSAGHSNSNGGKYNHLLQEMTTEHEGGSPSSDLPEMPDWVQKGIKYSCQRSTPAQSPNEAFIALLQKIKLARILTNDEIGVRAYSTSIASLAAYPYEIHHPREILALPGCEAKIANLFVEYANTGVIRAVEDLDADEDLKVLKLFYQIWGVGATTAREFYYDRGWCDLDDVVEQGWSGLSRVQQIGVKFYDEFLERIPRKEVEKIGAVVHRHACKVRDERMQSLIVGGYRRGKEACGDVDIILSHPDESQTLHIIADLVTSLENEGWITHTLLLSEPSTHRNQETRPLKAAAAAAAASAAAAIGHGAGFDTLDKALVVWQDPRWPTSSPKDHVSDDNNGYNNDNDNKKQKNPNIHRRVDIIIAPWRTVGCAVLGWSGGTTFQRDLRRYVKNTRGWKFDSSGCRDRGSGQVLDLEGWDGGGVGKAETMAEAERRVFDGLGLVYREPWERCTG